MPSPAAAPMPALALSGVTVRFGTFTANDRIDFSVGSGEVHALLGENGAGKTTLMRVVAGLLKPQDGTIAINGTPVTLNSPLDAAALGIGMVHQHFMLVPPLSVAQNAALGLPRVGRFFPDMRRVRADLAEISERYGLEVDPDAIVGDLTVAGQQRVEIVKALYRGARIFVLDEPTAVLAPKEVEGLFRVLRMLAEAGTAMVFISHKLNEVMEISNRVSVLRQGKLVATRATAETSGAELARLMIGSDFELPHVSDTVPQDAPVRLEARSLAYRDERGVPRLDGLDLSVRRGEIVGIAGVDGNGQQELAEVLTGLRQPQSGTLMIDGTDVTGSDPARRIGLGLAHVPEDRQRTGIVDLSIAENAVLETIDRPPASRRGILSHSAIRAFAETLIADYDVRCTGPRQPITTLSGGNQQKVILGRALSRDPGVIVAVQPTRGLDVGATAFVHRQLLEQRRRGAAIVLVSTELDEVLALSDRVLVIYAGRIVGELPRNQIALDRLSALMTGQAAA
ncbi:nucleoside ABC transporter ATP-binding protein [Devosia enhydra]|uniref:Nucleoside ABC transporter ATP-binding protein n=1 Tax=Devosia enhydra TaxID=665118 RepID=A0A1K2HZI5_9HYPH|nr:ABC transporter ATP-binding protein [Devosia enhydra]SFZ85431.1 nucleoside ABC transporter ATP-binding protein [Devosia enhydra]